MAVALATKQWTLEELHSLPDDGNKYELIHGELFVTPPPTDPHETIAAKLTRLLDPYVAEHNLGFVYHPRSVLRVAGSEVEPDLMVRAPQADPNADWDKAPIPLLIVEIFSPSTRRRDQQHKRDFYMEVAVPEYWMVDPERRTVTVVRSGAKDVVTSAELSWHPRGADVPLTFDVAAMFP